MSITLTAFLGLTAAMAAVATFAAWSRRDTHHRRNAVLALLVAAPIAFFALQAPLGYPDYDAPPAGRYAVLGARIDVDVAIYVLLDGPEPHLYRLPYTTAAANALQSAMDNAAQGEGGVEAVIGDDGEAVFHPEPVTEGEPKQAERPSMEIG